MQILGIQLDGSQIKAALIQTGRAGIRLCALESASLRMIDRVKQLYTGSFRGRIASGLSSRDLMVRPIEFEIPDNRYLDAALALQLEGSPHLQSDQLFSLAHLIRQEKGRVYAHLCSVSKEALKEHLAVLAELQIDPDSVSSNSLGLIRYVRWKNPELENAVIVDLGLAECSCVWMEKGELKKACCIPGGVERLWQALWEDRKKILLIQEKEEAAKQLDLLQLKSHFNPRLSEEIDRLRSDLGRAVCSFFRDGEKRAVVFTGNTEAFLHLPAYLVEAFEERICPLSQQNSDPHHFFAIPIGLALEQMKKPLQLLRNEFFPKKHWRRTKKYAFGLFFASMVCSALIGVWGWRQIAEEKKTLSEHLAAAMLPWDFPSSIMQGEDLGGKIRCWADKMALFRKEYPYILSSPRVGEVLSWIWNHPLLLVFQQEGDPLEIRDLHYQLLSYPTLDTPQEPYQVKVELAFSLKNSLHARQFHEALLADMRIDQEEELEWDASEDQYQTAFILKNHQEPYVP